MKILNKILVIGMLITFLSGCASLAAIGSVVGSWFGSSSSSNSGLQVDTNLQAQNGDNQYKGKGNDQKAKKVEGDQTGNDKYNTSTKTTNTSQSKQTNYQASKLTVNEGSFWETIGALLIGFILCAILFFLIGLYRPQPKHFQNYLEHKKIKKEINNNK